ncbi:MAG: ATP-binding protein [Pseudomonadota bacterium]
MNNHKGPSCCSRFWPCLFIINILAFLVSSCHGAPAVFAGDRVVTVGVYENAPKIFTAESGKPAGIFIDIIEHIAKTQGWDLRYVSGTWGQGLDRVEKGEIDLMPDVAYTSDRSRIYAFHKVPVLSSWYQVYAPEKSRIQTILDLNGKRILVLERSVQQEAFTRLSKGFGLNMTLISVPDYDTMFATVAKGGADAAITNRFYGMMHAKQFGLVDTAVIFEPSDLFFAAPKNGDNDILTVIDEHLDDLKQDHASIYYQSLKRWSSEDVQFKLPEWVKNIGIALGVFLLMSLAGGILLKRQVNARTTSLSHRNAQMAIMDRTLRAAATERYVPAILENLLQGALDLTGVESGVLCLSDPETKGMSLSAVRNVSGKMAARLTINASRMNGCFSGCALDSGKPSILRGNNATNSPAAQPSSDEEGFRFHASFPLKVKDEIIAMLCIFSNTGTQPDQQAMDLVEDICSTVAMAIQNARLFEQARHHEKMLEQKVAEQTAELTVAMEQAMAADRLKSAFLATMSHELRTPLNSIIGFTGIMLQGLAGPLNEEQHKQLSMVQGSSRHLLALINDVLDISKIEAGQLNLSVSSFALKGSIEKMVKLVSPQAKAKGIALRIEMDENVDTVTTDQRRLEQVILNLLNNAVKFTETGEVSILCRRDHDHYRISVSDTGIGIKPEEISGLFQPFHQIDTGLSRKHEGTGLGLSICWKLITMMNGTIDVQSVWEKGSTFTVRLPVA